jgi:hypothetical protein
MLRAQPYPSLIELFTKYDVLPVSPKLEKCIPCPQLIESSFPLPR